jgi:hypothetical protein
VKVWPFAAASAAACGLGLFAALLVPGEARAAALWGAGAASVSGACALAALVALAGKGTGVNGVLAGFTAGFLVRAALVAVGLVVSGARGNLALVYVVAFFILYAATQVIEVLFVQKRSRA